MILPSTRRILLYPLEWLYTSWMRRRRRWYEARPERRHKAAVPVISVGNLSMGGTGKTPMAIWLMQQYFDQGKRPAYLSRGYGRNSSGYMLLSPDHHAREVGDESLMVALRFPDLPVAVCESRKEGIQRLTKTQQPDVIILDDAFQHLKVHRDVDMVMMDAGRMPDQDFPFPGGRLREPLSTLAKADLFVINKLRSEQQWNQLRMRMAPWGKPVYGTKLRPSGLLALDRQTQPLPSTGQSVILFSGLGNNHSFRSLAESMGLPVKQHFTFGDHHFYRLSDLDKILQLSRQYPEALLLTTEKDLMRLRHHKGLHAELAERIHAVTVELIWMEKAWTVPV